MAMHTAQARSNQSGDLFNDKGWAPYNRPAVPSDQQKGSDLFPTNNYVLNPRADLFGSVHPNYDFGRSDMFPSRPKVVPYYPLFKDQNHAPR